MKTPKIVFAMVALFIRAAFIFAQPSGGGGGALRRLEWEGVKDVVDYEVRLEMRVENQWKQILRQTVRGKLYLDRELQNGDYRFCVRSFDIIGRPGDTSEWMEFSVAPPRSKKQAAGRKSGAEQPAAASAAAAAAAGGGGGMQPIQVKLDGSVDIAKSLWCIGTAAAPFVALPLGTFNDYYKDAVFQPAGFLLNIEMMPFRAKTSAFGIQLLPSWNFFTLEKFNTLRSSHLIALNAAFVWQIKILRATVLNIRAGGGGVLFISHGVFDSGGAQAQKNAFNPVFIAGINVRTFFANALFIDVGADYFHCIASDDAMANFVRPFLGIGWWF